MIFKKILVPFDGSEQSVKALELGITLAKGAKAQLTVLNVAEHIPVPGEPTNTLFMIEQEMKQIQELEVKKARHVLQGRGVNADIVTLSGHPSDQILKYAKKQKSDLIIIGNRGKSAIDRFLLGSVSETVSHHAHCAVLIAR